jgi:hypothetical protein
MTSGHRSVTVPGMQQAMEDITTGLSDGRISLQAVEGERGNLAVAYQSERAFPVLNQAIMDWETTFQAVMRELETFRVQLDAAAHGYSAADTAAADEAARVRQQVSAGGLPGF